MTLKEIQALSKGNKYPYAEVASKLNNLSVDELDNIDRIVAEGEQSSMKMVGIKKLYRMVKNPVVKDKMKYIYGLQFIHIFLKVKN